MKRSGPIKRKKALTRSTTPIRKVNPEAKAKRVANQKRHYASAEYKAARKEALKRSGGFCEYEERRHPNCVTGSTFYGMYNEMMNTIVVTRCTERDRLEAHHLSYPKSRPLEGSDLLMVCRRHHNFLEKRDHPTRHQR